MLVVFVFLCVCLILNIKISIGIIDKDYLSKDYTQVVKGVFIIIVFLSHIKGYADFASKGDIFVKNILQYLGQLMVAFFLFVSGYGVFEAIKKKGKEYICFFPKNRIAKTFFDFSLAILLFLFLDLLLGKAYSGKTVLLAFTGWTSIGNSNWYMFAIFVMYIITFISFFIFEHSREMAIIAVSVLSLIYIYIMSTVKETWWSDTCLCYVAGMWFSYFKEHIDKVMEYFSPWSWRIGIVLLFSCYYVISGYRYNRLLAYNVVAICFCLLIVFILMKVSFDSKCLRWCGENLFWLYILQRIPMIFWEHYGMNVMNPYFYLLLCAGGTIGLAWIMNKIDIYITRKTWWR